MEEDKILQELQTPENKYKWYKTSWGILLLLVALIIVIFIWLFINKVNYYKNVIQNGDIQDLDGFYVDASQYSKTGEQVSRTEVETGDDPYWGPVDAKVVVVEFADFQCPYCKKSAPITKLLKDNYSDKVKFIFRDLPLTYIHPQAMIAAQAAQCANDQFLFWPFHDILYEQQNLYETTDDLVAYAVNLGMDENTFSICLISEKYKDEVNMDLQEGIRLGVQGTPTFFINGLKVNGVLDYDTFKIVLDRFLEKL